MTTADELAAPRECEACRVLWAPGHVKACCCGDHYCPRCAYLHAGCLNDQMNEHLQDMMDRDMGAS